MEVFCRWCYNGINEHDMGYTTDKVQKIGGAMVLGIDVDGVLRNFVAEVLKIYNSESDKKLKHEDIKAWNIEGYIGITYEEFKNKYIIENSHLTFGSALPYELDIAKKIRNLKYDGHSIHIVTSQWPETQKHTIDWLVANEIEYDSLHFTPNRSMVKTDILIDDRTSNLIEVETLTDTISVCMDRPWNKDYKGFRVKDFGEFINLVKNTNLLKEFMK